MVGAVIEDVERPSASDRLLSPLPVGAVVTLEEPGLARPGVQGRLASPDLRHLAVELHHHEGADALVIGTEVRLRCGTDAGLYLARTSVLAHDDDVVHLDAPSASRFVQRRRHRRVPVQLSMSCRRLGEVGRGPVDVVAVDLSAGGVRIVAPDGLELGEVILLTVADDIDAVGHRGTVVDVRDSPEGPGERHARVAFSASNPATTAALQRLLLRHH